MKYCGLARVTNNRVTWSWFKPADYYIEILGRHPSFESYCKAHAGEEYIYVEVDDEEV